MTKPLIFTLVSVFGSLAAQGQFVIYRFTDGSEVIHPVTDVRSTDFEGDAMRVFLWDGTTYTWSLESLAHYQFTDISAAVPEQGAALAPVLVYPNPTSGEVRIGITVSGSSDVVVNVMDLRGSLVRTVHRGTLPKGARELVWDGRDAHGQPVADGNYLVRLAQGPRAATKQVIIQR